MQISVLEIIKIFQVEEKTIYDWISKKQMPCLKVNGQYRFNYVELLEWALQNRIPLTPDILTLGESEHHPSEVLSEALKRGGVYYDIPGKNRREVLGNMVSQLPFPMEVDRASLLEMFLAREGMESTAVGKGVALPHLRNPVVLNVEEPFVALCFLKEAVDFNAFDRKPVSILFAIVSPSIKTHLLLLSHLSFCLQDPGFQKYLQKRAFKEQLIAEVIVIESKLTLQKKAYGGIGKKKRQ